MEMQYLLNESIQRLRFKNVAPNVWITEGIPG